MLMRGKVAIVSGVGPGLGRASALALAREGADVVLGARTRGVLEEVAREVEALGHQALVVPTDVTDPEQAKNIADTAFQHFGRIDVLVNNAAWSGPYETMLEMDIPTWRKIIDTNLVATMYMCRSAAPHMLKARRGSIVNVTTWSMRQGRERRSAYAAAKAGITLMTQSLAEEWGPSGVRVNCVALGQIWSDKLKAYYETRAKMAGKTYDETYAMFTGQMALRRVPTAEEIANGVLFMASDWASGITGQSLDVNCGHFFH